MRKIVLALIYLLLPLAYLIAGNDYSSNSIIIKFKSNSPILSKWLSCNRSGQINELIPFIGNNNSEGFLSNRFFNLPEKVNTLLSAPAKNSLVQIAVVSFEQNIDIDQILPKINSLDFIEYVEKMPINKLAGITNDPHIDVQYYIPKVRAHLAWGDINYMDTITVGVVDTGIDYTHPDLAQNIFINQGEWGLDNTGADKSKNGIDDDNNGYIDDWHGWDFAPTNSPLGDNNPYPGPGHGTHVSGIIGAVTNNHIGMAGTAKNVKLLPLKACSDDANETSLVREYDAIYYAARMGAKIINCSWGSQTRSTAVEELINTVTDMGALVVAAVCNDDTDKKYYPAAYKNVLSVAAIDEYNNKTSFSNYGDYVDVCAPGINIWSTLPDSTYQYQKGTSQACPIAAAVASIALMTHKSYNPVQIKELVRLTTDTTIYATEKTHRIGTGCVDAYNAVNYKNVKSIVISGYDIHDNNADGAYTPEDSIYLNIDLLNVLSPCSKISVKAFPNDTNNYFSFIKDSVYIDSMTSYQKINLKNAFVFKMNQSIPYDYYIKFKLKVYIDTLFMKELNIDVLVNPSFINITHNNISITANSSGNLGYNNYPTNSQGIGIKYKNSNNLLFEGALMIAVGKEKVSDAARSYSGIKMQNFSADKIISDSLIEKYNLIQAFTSFNDKKSDESYGLSVNQYLYESNRDEYMDFVITEYNVKNISKQKMDSLYLGLFLDWDIGASGSNNKAIYDRTHNFYYVFNQVSDSLPYMGVKLITPQPVNYYGITNNGNEAGVFGLYDGFSKYEKWLSLSSGIYNDTTNQSDISAVISAGPVVVDTAQTAKIAFSIFGGASYEDLVKTAAISADYYPALNKDESLFFNQSIKVYPNPVTENGSYIQFMINTPGNYNLAIYNYSGELINNIIDNQSMEIGLHTIYFNPNTITNGTYILKLSSKDKQIAYQLFSVTK